VTDGANENELLSRSRFGGGWTANPVNVLSVHTGSWLGGKGIHSLQPLTNDWNNQPIMNCVNTAGSVKYSSTHDDVQTRCLTALTIPQLATANIFILKNCSV